MPRVNRGVFCQEEDRKGEYDIPRNFFIGYAVPTSPGRCRIFTRRVPRSKFGMTLPAPSIARPLTFFAGRVAYPFAGRRRPILFDAIRRRLTNQVLSDLHSCLSIFDCYPRIFCGLCAWVETPVISSCLYRNRYPVVDFEPYSTNSSKHYLSVLYSMDSSTKSQA